MGHKVRAEVVVHKTKTAGRVALYKQHGGASIDTFSDQGQDLLVASTQTKKQSGSKLKANSN